MTRFLLTISAGVLLAGACNRKQPTDVPPPSAAEPEKKKSVPPDEEAWPCYAPEMQKDPALKGDVQVSFEVAPDGQVDSARVVGTSLHNVNVELCVVSLVNKWKMANPTGQRMRGAKYTFRFHPPAH